MAYLYLIRHGDVVFDDNIKRCIGTTDVVLSDIGKKRVQKLHQYLEKQNIQKIYTSPLSRCIETSLMLGLNVEIEKIDDLKEIYMGEWENQPLASLKKNLESEPLNGEGRTKALLRFTNAIDNIIHQNEGNIAVVSHAGIICAYLSSLLKTSLETSRALAQPYGCVSKINITDHNRIVDKYGFYPYYPDYKDIEQLYKKYKTPIQVIEHCQMVCEVALKISRFFKVDQELIKVSALLHDLVRTRKNHAYEGCCVLRHEGYNEIAEIVKYHHDIVFDASLEAKIVYLADKYVQGTQIVSIDERFLQSQKKCLTIEAKLAHQKRYQQAKDIEDYLRKKGHYEID